MSTPPRGTPRRLALLFLASTGVAAGALACNLVVGTYEFRDATDGGAADVHDAGVAEDASCDVDLSVACYACAPQTNEQFLNACGESPCIPFDRSRLESLLLPDGGLPPLPPLDDAGGT
jgi:hypothetical protein